MDFLPMQTDAISPGDLVFVHSKMDARVPLDNAIEAVGAATIDWLRRHGVSDQSNETAVHVAIAWRNRSDGNALSFVEATPPADPLRRARQQAY